MRAVRRSKVTVGLVTAGVAVVAAGVEVAAAGGLEVAAAGGLEVAAAGGGLVAAGKPGGWVTSAAAIG